MEDKLDGFKQAISNGLCAGLYYRVSRNPDTIKDVEPPMEYKRSNSSTEYMLGYYYNEYQHCSLGYRIGFIIGYKLGCDFSCPTPYYYDYMSDNENNIEIKSFESFETFSDKVTSIVEEKILPKYLEEIFIENNTNGPLFELFYLNVIDILDITNKIPEKHGSDPEWLYESCLT